MSAIGVNIQGVWAPVAKDAASKPVKGVLSGWLSLQGLHIDNKPPAPQPPPAEGSPPHVDNTLPGDLPHPAHPIELPPPSPGEPSKDREIKLVAHWDESTNSWQTVVVIVPADKALVPTPSRR